MSKLGITRYYDDDGNLTRVENISRHRIHDDNGIPTEWEEVKFVARCYKNGQSIDEGSYDEQGRKRGCWQGFYKSGKLRYESAYDENGKRVAHIEWNKNGVETFREELRW